MLVSRFLVAMTACAWCVALLACATAAQAPVAGSVAAAGETGDASARTRVLLQDLRKRAGEYALANNRCMSALDQLSDTIARDAWGREVAYMQLESGTGSAFVSAGADGELLTADDIQVQAPCGE